MKNKALTELRDHAEKKLWPFPDRMRWLDGANVDFHTEAFIFYMNAELAFRELQDNIAAVCTKDEESKYAVTAIRYLQNARSQVNQFFEKDRPEYNEYNKVLQQIEAEGVSETPGSGLTPEVSISKDKLEYPVEAVALYVNKISLWAEQLFSGAVAAPAEPEQIELQDVQTINEKLLLLKYTGVFEFIETSCGNKKKTAAVIAAIIGEKTDSIRVISTHLDTPHKKNRLSPYTAKAVANVLMILRNLEFNTDELEKIYNNLARDHKS